ncbi:hypothetical protein I7I48_07493 [Histoplasma ohiense]|nr:hypothetical protein I7I48_07493 [Histoplasma ohiense (nom. inval.)]
MEAGNDVQDVSDTYEGTDIEPQDNHPRPQATDHSHTTAAEQSNNNMRASPTSNAQHPSSHTARLHAAANADRSAAMTPRAKTQRGLSDHR